MRSSLKAAVILLSLIAAPFCHSAEPIALLSPEIQELSPGGKKVSFQFFGHKDGDKFANLVFLRVTDPANGRILQEIPHQDSWHLPPAGSRASLLELEDWNGDGRADLAIISSESAAPNMIYRWFEYRPQTCRFEKSPLTRDMERHGINQVNAGSYDAYNRGGPEKSRTIFRVAKGRLVLAKNIYEGRAASFSDILPGLDPDTHVRITTIYRGGKMVRRFYSFPQD